MAATEASITKALAEDSRLGNYITAKIGHAFAPSTQVQSSDRPSVQDKPDDNLRLLSTVHTAMLRYGKGRRLNFSSGCNWVIGTATERPYGVVGPLC